MRFHDRPDGVLLTKLPFFRKMYPFIMPSRMEATIYTTRRVSLRNALAWLERVNATREDKLNLFHVVLASAVRMLALQPDLNRFVSGRRIFQRRTIDISFVVSREMTERSTETMVKMTFDPYSTIETVARQVNAVVQSTKKSKTSHDETMSRLLNLMPRFLIRALMRTARILDYFGLLPASYIKKDSMYTSIFITNLGSINADAILHPMFEWGNAPFFIVIGKRKKEPVVNDRDEIQVDEVMDVTFTLDQRITGGFNLAQSGLIVRDLFQNPDALLQKPETIPDPFTMA
jgi:hypothetical protein